jgi:hypothetical protein
MHQVPEPREVLAKLLDALVAADDAGPADLVRQALAGPPDELMAFLASNELWGGAGSIADQAGSELGRASRRPLEAVLIQLGETQLARGIANPRTRMWIDAFQMWQDEGI